MSHERLRLGLAHAAVWTIWGSTYLAVRFTVQTVPPFLMTGSRFLAAGLVLFAWLRWRGEPWPEAAHWRSGVIVGVLLVGGGNGGVAWTAQTVPSGLIALSVALMPGWMLLFDWLATGARPTRPLVVGLVLGFTGVGLLIGPEHLRGTGVVHPAGALALAVASIAWATGSIYSRASTRPRSAFMHTAVQMIAGGGLLIGIAVLLGEPARIAGDGLRQASVWAAWGYLVVLGSIVAYSAYVYLLHHTSPGKASAYAYVNPVIAVLLGWGIGGEPMNGRILLAGLLVVAAVATIIRFRGRMPPDAGRSERPAPSSPPVPRRDQRR